MGCEALLDTPKEANGSSKPTRELALEVCEPSPLLAAGLGEGLAAIGLDAAAADPLGIGALAGGDGAMEAGRGAAVEEAFCSAILFLTKPPMPACL